MVTPPHKKSRQVQTMVRMQMRQQHMHRRGIRVPLQRAEHTPAEVDNQRRCVRRSEQIPRRRRIRPHDATGASEHGYPHGHYCAMPDTTMRNTSTHSVTRISSMA